MPQKKSKRWVLAILMATVLPALAFHASCIAVLGPGNWGSGVEEKLPPIMPGASNPGIAPYTDEFAATQVETVQPVFPGDASALSGTIFWVDSLEEAGLWVVQTYEGKQWVEGQHIYLWSSASPKLEELEIPGDVPIERPTLLQCGPGILVVYGRWHSWAVPPIEKLERYLRSYFNSKLRPEHSLYTYNLETRERTYLGPGHTLVPAPNRRRALFLRSGALGLGYYSLHMWDCVSGEVSTLISLREADEGSGRSFDYRWSHDSQAVQLTGVTGGFARRKRERRDLNLIFLVDEEEVYEVE